MISTKEQRIATIGTAIFCVLFFLILLMVRFINDPTEEEEGVLVNFGDTEQGMGQVEPRPAVAQNSPTPPPTPSEPAPSEPEPTPSETNNNNEEPVETQKFEDAASMNDKAKKEKADKDKAEKEKAAKEAAKKAAEDAAKEKARLDALAKAEEKRKNDSIADAQQKQQQKKDIDDRFKNAITAGRNAAGGNTGEGNTTGNGNQGSPNGDINSTNRVGNGGGNGINFNLAGRSFGSEPPKPEYKSKSEGKVVVEIRVDRSGKVISASPGKAGTTTNDPILREAAKAAALKAKFNSDPKAAEVQVGTITYTFIQQ